ncbi:head maturation protease, ClpP-related [Cytobacillus firmus]|uniref:head maturation protease, ClpP-related n=1 Tax=Cytobacillus firmus TaxID=1399 RepID=UPI0018CDB2DC|nr:head maturation protease, ClpP-related [Cytobacillus firmus]MBG9657089.1 peptidase [Cytobacillus firmus]MED1906761.1 Clp protease ClpP [Cytobacillus firmus]
MKHQFLNIKNSTDEKVDFYIYGDIVPDTDWKWDDTEVMPNDIKNLLDEHKGKKINLYVNSGGGSVFAGLAMYNMLKRHDGEIIAHVDGVAGSIASVIVMAADKIIVPKNAYLMIHKAWTWAVGNANDLRKQADDLDRIDEGIFNTYKEKLKEGIEEETIKQMIEDETWLTGEQAAEFFAIETSDSLEAVACASDFYQNYKFIPSKLVKNKEQGQLSKEPKKVENSTQNESDIESLLMEIDLI